MRRVVTLPSEGRVVVGTDLQGNLRDFERLISVFEDACREPGGAVLVVTGDLVHGPEIEEADWPEHLGTYYRGDSPGVLARARALEDEHPGRVHFLMGNHEHAHVGGPVVSKFFPDEAERLESLLGDEDAESFRDWIASWPFVAIAPHACLAMTHAAPHAAIESASDIEDLELDMAGDLPPDLDGRSVLLALLWARTTSTDRVRAFLRALDPRLAVSVYGHDVAHTGYAIDREPLLCISTSFGCHDGDKLYLTWDLARPARSAAEVARDGLRALYPDAQPIHRRND